jgi:SAM-dependent methyltransferase
MQRWLYNLFYRTRAPWEGFARAELVAAVRSADLTPERLAPGRAIDLGCGSGANAIFLAEQGFDVVGVDFSPVAIAKAKRHAEASHARARLRFVVGDLRSFPIPGVEGPFDLALDWGSIDDLSAEDRRCVAETAARLVRPGGELLLHCFYRPTVPFMSMTGPSRLFPVHFTPGEEERLFGAHFFIRRNPTPPEGSGFAAFRMVRRS